MHSILNAILNLRKEISKLKNVRAHTSNPIQRDNITNRIASLESILKIMENEILPFVKSLPHPLNKMVLDSYFKGVPFSYGVQLHQLMHDEPNAIKTVRKNMQKKNKKLNNDAFAKKVAQCIEDKYRKQLYRAIDHFNCH